MATVATVATVANVANVAYVVALQKTTHKIFAIKGINIKPS